MKKTTLLAFLLILFINSFSQSEKYPKGAYMTLEEILLKNPSENRTLEIEKRTTGDIRFSGGNDYKLISPDKSIKKKILKRKVLAYSDGDTLYLNCLPYRAFAWFTKVESDGKYFVVKAALSQNTETQKMQLNPSSGMYGQFGALGGAIGGAKLAELRFLYALDKETNEFIYIFEESLKEILKENINLLRKYEKEKEPNEFPVLLKYITLHNEQN